MRGRALPVPKVRAVKDDGPEPIRGGAFAGARGASGGGGGGPSGEGPQGAFAPTPAHGPAGALRWGGGSGVKSADLARLEG